MPRHRKVTINNPPRIEFERVANSTQGAYSFRFTLPKSKKLRKEIISYLESCNSFLGKKIKGGLIDKSSGTDIAMIGAQLKTSKRTTDPKTHQITFKPDEKLFKQFPIYVNELKERDVNRINNLNFTYEITNNEVTLTISGFKVFKKPKTPKTVQYMLNMMKFRIENICFDVREIKVALDEKYKGKSVKSKRKDEWESVTKQELKNIVKRLDDENVSDDQIIQEVQSLVLLQGKRVLRAGFSFERGISENAYKTFLKYFKENRESVFNALVKEYVLTFTPENIQEIPHSNEKEFIDYLYRYEERVISCSDINEKDAWYVIAADESSLTAQDVLDSYQQHCELLSKLRDLLPEEKGLIQKANEARNADWYVSRINALIKKCNNLNFLNMPYSERSGTKFVEWQTLLESLVSNEESEITKSVFDRFAIKFDFNKDLYEFIANHIPDLSVVSTALGTYFIVNRQLSNEEMDDIERTNAGFRTAVLREFHKTHNVNFSLPTLNSGATAKTCEIACQRNKIIEASVDEPEDNDVIASVLLALKNIDNPEIEGDERSLVIAFHVANWLEKKPGFNSLQVSYKRDGGEDIVDMPGFVAASQETVAGLNNERFRRVLESLANTPQRQPENSYTKGLCSSLRTLAKVSVSEKLNSHGILRSQAAPTKATKNKGRKSRKKVNFNDTPGFSS